MTTTDEILNKLRPYYEESPQTFDFNAGMLLAGDNNKAIRVVIIQELTGRNTPKSKATLGAVINAIVNTYQSPTLF